MRMHTPHHIEREALDSTRRTLGLALTYTLSSFHFQISKPSNRYVHTYIPSISPYEAYLLDTSCRFSFMEVLIPTKVGFFAVLTCFRTFTRPHPLAVPSCNVRLEKEGHIPGAYVVYRHAHVYSSM